MLSRDEFAERFIRGLQCAGEKRPVHYDADIFCLVIGETREAPDIVIGMGEAFQDCQAVPADRLATEIDRLATRYYRQPLPEDYASAQAQLTVCLKHSSYLDLHADFSAAWSGSVPRSALAHVNVTGEIVCCIGFLDGPAMQFVTRERLHQWGVSVEQAVSAGIANVGRSTLELSRSGSIYTTLPSDLDASARFLFLSHVFDKLSLDGSPVVLVPDQHSVIITGSNSREGLVQMAALAQISLEESAQSVSAQPLVWDHGDWKLFEPPAAVKPAFSHLAQAFEVDRYRAQSGVLALRYRHSEDRVGMSEVRLFPTSYGYQSHTIWRSDRPALLPKADKIALDDKATGTFQVADWADVMRVVGDRMVAVHNPVRFRVDRFPTREEIQAMNATVLRVRGHQERLAAPEGQTNATPPTHLPTPRRLVTPLLVQQRMRK